MLKIICINPREAKRKARNAALVSAMVNIATIAGIVALFAWSAWGVLPI